MGFIGVKGSLGGCDNGLYKGSCRVLRGYYEGSIIYYKGFGLWLKKSRGSGFRV